MDLMRISAVSEFVRAHYDRGFVSRFEPRHDQRIGTITDRVIASVPDLPREPRPIDVYDAWWGAAKERDPEAFAVDDGTEYIADPFWKAGFLAAFAAAVAYGYPEFVTPDEYALLVRDWETVAGRKSA